MRDPHCPRDPYLDKLQRGYILACHFPHPSMLALDHQGPGISKTVLLQEPTLNLDFPLEYWEEVRNKPPSKLPLFRARCGFTHVFACVNVA